MPEFSELYGGVMILTKLDGSAKQFDYFNTAKVEADKIGAYVWQSPMNKVFYVTLTPEA